MQPMIGANDLCWISGGGKNLGDQRVGVEGDGGQELGELVGTHCLLVGAYGLLSGVLLCGVAGIILGVAGLGVVLAAGILRVAGILGIAGVRSLVWGSIRLLCKARIGRLVGSRIGLLSIAGVLRETGIRSLVKSDIGMRDIAGILRLPWSRGKIELSRVVRQGSAVGRGNWRRLLGIGRIGCLIGCRN